MLVIATVEANKSDLMMLAADSPRQNFFNLTELTLNLPLSQRLASRIEQILQRSSGTIYKYFMISAIDDYDNVQVHRNQA